jgi:hypothetical protein
VCSLDWTLVILIASTIVFNWVFVKSKDLVRFVVFVRDPIRSYTPWRRERTTRSCSLAVVDLGLALGRVASVGLVCSRVAGRVTDRSLARETGRDSTYSRIAVVHERRESIARLGSQNECRIASNVRLVRCDAGGCRVEAASALGERAPAAEEE